MSVLEQNFSEYISKGHQDNCEVDYKSYSLGKDVLVIEKWSWDYECALKFQEISQGFVALHRDKKIFIFTNHPRLFTMGRGLQKSKSKVIDKLQEFDQSKISELKFPVFNIKRGGGITFHYPGQWIFYPIVNLNHPDNNLKDLIYFMLDTAKSVLYQRYNLLDIDIKRELIGIWKGNFKLGSVGIGLKQFITYHGMAFNIYYDNKMFEELEKVNPCGLSSNTYRCLRDFINTTTSAENLLIEFHNHYVSELRKTFF